MIVFLLYYLISTVSSSPTLDCFFNSKRCAFWDNVDTLLETHVNVITMEECSILCIDTFSCSAFTHFGPNSGFIANGCLLFSSCSQREPCKDCVSGTRQNECDCGIEFEGLRDASNFVDLVAGVADESYCKELCAENDDCNIYTYYDYQDTMKARTCFLLTSKGLQQPVTLCEHCKTGPGRCQTGQKCQVAVIANSGNSATQALFLEESTRVDFVAAEKDCFHNITVTAIGGGGHGYHGEAGGGSGYVDFGNITLVPDSLPLEVMVGGPQHPSYIEGRGINASRGMDPYSLSGGDGYSGGGANSGAGGSDGGNGEYSLHGIGGKGSGLNLKHITMAHFILTPAEGGDNGGGGGGVLVNGKGPDGNGYSMRGFGGGGDYSNIDGNSGCVLIEL